MHPQVQQPNPGSCPICGMDLIPLAADHEEDEDSPLPRLRVSARAATLMQIQTVPAERRDAHASIRLPGRVAVDETRLSTIASWFGGRVERLFVDFTGQQVRQGDKLLEIYSPELFGVQEEYLQAVRAHEQQDVESSRRILEGARDRLRLLGLSPEQIYAIEEAGKPSTRLAVYAPADGVVTDRLVAAGQYVETGEPLFKVADLSQVWAELEAFESELALLRVGQSVDLQLNASPDASLQGEIAFIDPVVDASKRSARVRVDLSNEQGVLKPGMLVVGTVAAQPGSSDSPPLLIPASAPLHTGERAVVYVQLPDADRPTFEARDVLLGHRLGDYYSVLEGLAEGDRVVVNGQFKIDSELQIRGRPSMMTPDDQTSDPRARASQLADPRELPEREAFADGVDPAFGQELQPLFDEYLLFVESLAADAPAAADAALEAMRNQLQEIGEHRLAGEPHLSWMDHYNRLDQALAAAGQQDDLADYRGVLQEITSALEAIYINFGAGELPPLKRALCPMVGDGIGTWLQQAEGIRNPYFGAQMLTCGEIFGELGASRNP